MLEVCKILLSFTGLGGSLESLLGKFALGRHCDCNCNTNKLWHDSLLSFQETSREVFAVAVACHILVTGIMMCATNHPTLSHVSPRLMDIISFTPSFIHVLIDDFINSL